MRFPAGHVNIVVYYQYLLLSFPNAVLDIAVCLAILKQHLWRRDQTPVNLYLHRLIKPNNVMFRYLHTCVPCREMSTYFNCLIPIKNAV